MRRAVPLVATAIATALCTLFVALCISTAHRNGARPMSAESLEATVLTVATESYGLGWVTNVTCHRLGGAEIEADPGINLYCTTGINPAAPTENHYFKVTVLNRAGQVTVSPLIQGST